MIRILFLVACFWLLLSSCNNRNNDEVNAPKSAKGGRVYGGVFSFSVPEKPKNLFPYTSINYYDQILSSQIYEPLFTLDSSQNVIGNLAEKYELLNDNKTFRVYLRKDILFHNGTSRFTAQDVLFSIALACSKFKNNNYSSLLIDKLEGANSFFINSDVNSIHPEDFKGIKIISDYILDIKLVRPYAQFPFLLTHPNLVMLSYENFKKDPSSFFKNAFGTGPFRLNEINENNISLKRNDYYWKKDVFGNRLPFLNGITVFYNIDENKYFKEGKINMIQNVSTEKINELFGGVEEAKKGGVQKHRLYQQKNKNLNFLLFNTNCPPFNNLLNRQFVSELINNEEICSTVLDGGGDACGHAFVPKQYFQSISSLYESQKNINKTKNNYSKAGGLNKINVFVNAAASNWSKQWVNEASKQIEAASGIKVSIVYGSDDDLQRLWKNGEVHLARYGWVADFLDPDSFLGIFYSSSAFAKEIGFKNSDYDQIYLSTFQQKTKDEQLKAQFLCDQFLINNFIVHPVFVQDFVFVVNVNMRDFRINSSGLIDLSRVYNKPIQKIN